MVKFFRMELYRSVTDRRFIFIIILIMTILFGSITEYLQAVIQYGVLSSGGYAPGVLDKIYEIQVFDRFKALQILLVTGLVSCTVSDDISSHFARPVLAKIDTDTYVLVKWLVNLICIMLAVFASYSIFALLGRLVLGMPMNSNIMFSTYFGEIIRYFPAGYIFLAAVLFSLFASVVTTVGMIVTVLYPGRYLTYAISFGIYQILLSISGFFPTEISLWYISAGVQVLNIQGFLPNYLYAVGIMLFLSFIGKNLLGAVIKRRIKDGKI